MITPVYISQVMGKIYLFTYAPSEDSDKPVQSLLCSLLVVFGSLVIHREPSKDSSHMLNAQVQCIFQALQLRPICQVFSVSHLFATSHLSTLYIIFCLLRHVCLIRNSTVMDIYYRIYPKY